MKKMKILLFMLALSASFLSLAGAHAEGAVLAMATPAVADVEAIAKWAGKYDRTMIMQMLNGLDVFKDLTVDRDVSRHGKLLPKFTVEAGLRPLDTNVEENDRKERTLGGRKLFVYDCMKLFKVIPEELRESFLADQLQPGAKREPFASWFWSREMEKLASEINDNFYNSEYHADAPEFSAAATYTAGQHVKFTDDNFYKCVTNTTAGESPASAAAKWELSNGVILFDGPGKIIADEITGANLAPIATGAITEADAFDQMREVYNSMAIAHKNRRGTIHVSHDVYEKYLTAELTKFGNSVASATMGNGRKYVYGTNNRWELKPCSWIPGQRIIVNLENRNLVAGTTITGTSARIGKVVETVHGYKTSAKFLLGFQIRDLECLYVNDQV
jgi:hypothetical protein